MATAYEKIMRMRALEAAAAKDFAEMVARVTIVDPKPEAGARNLAGQWIKLDVPGEYRLMENYRWTCVIGTTGAPSCATSALYVDEGGSGLAACESHAIEMGVFEPIPTPIEAEPHLDSKCDLAAPHEGPCRMVKLKSGRLIKSTPLKKPAEAKATTCRFPKTCGRSQGWMNAPFVRIGSLDFCSDDCAKRAAKVETNLPPQAGEARDVARKAGDIESRRLAPVEKERLPVAPIQREPWKAPRDLKYEEAAMAVVMSEVAEIRMHTQIERQNAQFRRPWSRELSASMKSRWAK